MSRNEPVGHTCPDIDNCIKWINTSLRSINYAIDLLETTKSEHDLVAFEDEVYNAIEAMKDARNHIDFGNVLNELRDSNSALRDWAYNLRSELEKMESA